MLQLLTLVVLLRPFLDFVLVLTGVAWRYGPPAGSGLVCLVWVRGSADSLIDAPDIVDLVAVGASRLSMLRLHRLLSAEAGVADLVLAVAREEVHFFVLQRAAAQIARFAHIVSSVGLGVRLMVGTTPIPVLVFPGLVVPILSVQGGVSPLRVILLRVVIVVLSILGRMMVVILLRIGLLLHLLKANGV